MQPALRLLYRSAQREDLLLGLFVNLQNVAVRCGNFNIHNHCQLVSVCHKMKSTMKQSTRVCVLSDCTLREFNPAGYLVDYAWEMFMPKKPMLKFLQSLHSSGRFDVYLNLCDGSDEKGDRYSGMDVLCALEELNLPFTGADSQCYDPSREAMQAAAEMSQIGFARGANVAGVGELEALVEDLRYPLMVKHPNSFGSTGMTKKSRVENERALQSQVKRICKQFGSARVEEYIDGREFTALVVDNPDDFSEPFVYPPAELIFPEGESFLHSNVKWKKWVYLKPVPDEALASKLMEMTCNMYRALRGVGYARCDIRMRESGALVMLEINPNCGILFKPEHLGPADVAMEYDCDGHAGFFERIFRSAVMRQQARMVRYSNHEVAHANLYSLG